MSDEKNAVLLAAHGTPDSVADVPEFLNNVTGGRELPHDIVKEIEQRYAQIGRSPLTEITLRQADNLQKQLGIPVYVGMRNWKPFIADAVKQMERDGIKLAATICMAPHNSRTSVGLYMQAILAATGSIRVEFVESWHDHPQLIAAFAEKLRPVWREASTRTGTKVPVIFTAHSVPARTITQGDPYDRQAMKTAELVMAEIPELEPRLFNFAFQSQGMAGGPWIGPTVQEIILRLKQAGHRAMVIQPIGFLCDHVEILYDIDISFKKFASQQAVELLRTESLNDSSMLIDALADLARTALKLPATMTAR